MVVRVRYRADRAVEQPVFQIAIIDVDTGMAITTASSTSADVPDQLVGEGTIECRFLALPLRPRQYVLRLSITDSHQLASYDVVTAGPRFAVAGRGRGMDSFIPSEDEDGLVSLPYEFAHHGAVVAATTRA